MLRVSSVVVWDVSDCQPETEDVSLCDVTLMLDDMDIAAKDWPECTKKVKQDTIYTKVLHGE